MRRAVVASLSALVAILASAPYARAHAILLQARPAPDASVEGPELQVELKFNSRIDPKRSRVTILMPDKTTKVLTSEPSSAPEVLKARGESFAPGSYTLRWQVLSSDGHITRGEHAFSVK